VVAACSYEARKFGIHSAMASSTAFNNKFLAKVASDINKPDGITVVTPEMADSFIDSLPVRKFFGVGKVTDFHTQEIGVSNNGQLLLPFIFPGDPLNVQQLW
jgi:nucleotidyltransferase/DNA polymerase involved in DNA repair